jgi:RNA polymerase sigma factor (sigma-70 family)
MLSSNLSRGGDAAPRGAPRQGPQIETHYRAYARDMRRLARRRVGAEDAEDVVQEAYLKLLAHGKDTLDGEAFKAFLIRVVINIGRDAARRSRVRMRSAALDSDIFVRPNGAQCSVAAIESATELAMVRRLAEELPQMCRDAFVLRWGEDLTESEIARRLGVTLRTIERRLARAHAFIRGRCSGESRVGEDVQKK